MHRTLRREVGGPESSRSTRKPHSITTFEPRACAWSRIAAAPSGLREAFSNVHHFDPGSASVSTRLKPQCFEPFADLGLACSGAAGQQKERHGVEGNDEGSAQSPIGATRPRWR